MKTDTMDTDDIENWLKEKRDARPNGKLAPYSELIKDLRAHGYNYADVGGLPCPDQVSACHAPRCSKALHPGGAARSLPGSPDRARFRRSIDR
jgi:hypothetical protein